MGFAAAAPWLVPLVMGAIQSGMNGSGGDDVFGDIFQQSLLSPEQQKLEKQRLRALQGPGGKGAFGQVADYYRGIMEPNSETEQSLVAPGMRQFKEQIIPDLAEQFAGMGAGNLSSSGFTNATVGAGTDLAERIGAIRAQLRQQGVQGLANLGNQSLVPTVENLRNQPQPSGGELLAEGISSQIPALTNYAMEYSRQNQNQNIQKTQDLTASTRNTSPYGKRGQALQMKPQTSGPYNLPTFGGY